MKIVATFLWVVLFKSAVGQNLDLPSDFNNNEILIYTMGYKEVIAEMTKEYERVNTKEECEERSQLIKNTPISNDRIIIGDIYGIMFDLKLVDWVNTIIEKAANKRRDKKLIIVNQTEVDTFSKEKYRYLLTYKYIINNNFPPRIQMVFFLRDRIGDKDLLDYENVETKFTFEPILAFAAEGDVFYLTIRRFKVKEELNAFINKNL